MQLGLSVVYRLTAEDAAQINRRRTDGISIAERIREGEWPLGAQAHIGSHVSAGIDFPMIVVRFRDDGSGNLWRSSYRLGRNDRCRFDDRSGGNIFRGHDYSVFRMRFGLMKFGSHCWCISVTPVGSRRSSVR